MNPSEAGAVILFLTAFAVGVRATYQVWRMSQRANPRLTQPGAALVLRLLVLICVVVTAACGYFGFLTVRRLLGFEPIDGTQVLSTLVVAGVVLLPQVILTVVKRVAEAGDDVRIARAAGVAEGTQNERDRQAGES